MTLILNIYFEHKMGNEIEGGGGEVGGGMEAGGV